MTLLLDVENYLQLASYQPGRIEFEPAECTYRSRTTIGRMSASLERKRMGCQCCQFRRCANTTVAKKATENTLKQKASETPLVQAALSVFPKAKITDVKSAADLAHEIEADALPEVDEEWDPLKQNKTIF